MDLAFATTPARQFKDLSADEMPDQVLDQTSGSVITAAPPMTLPESNSAEYASAGSGLKMALSEQLLALPSP